MLGRCFGACLGGAQLGACLEGAWRVLGGCGLGAAWSLRVLGGVRSGGTWRVLGGACEVLGGCLAHGSVLGMCFEGAGSVLGVCFQCTWCQCAYTTKLH